MNGKDMPLLGYIITLRKYCTIFLSSVYFTFGYRFGQENKNVISYSALQGTVLHEGETDTTFLEFGEHTS